MWGTEWPIFNMVIQGKYLLLTMTSNSLTENEEHGIPSQILMTVFGLHALVIFRPQYVSFPVHLKGHLIPLRYETLLVNWQNELCILFHQSGFVLSPNHIIVSVFHIWQKLPQSYNDPVINPSDRGRGHAFQPIISKFKTNTSSLLKSRGRSTVCSSHAADPRMWRNLAS